MTDATAMTMSSTPPLPQSASIVALRGCSSREVTTVVLPHVSHSNKLKALVKRNWR